MRGWRRATPSISRCGATISSWSGRAPSGPAGGATALPSRVLAIEYQGYFVKVMLDAVPDEDFVAYVPERTFFRDPFNVGDVVLATWPTGRARVLA